MTGIRWNLTMTSIYRVVIVTFFVLNAIWFSYLITSMLGVVIRDIEPYIIENPIPERYR